LTRNKIAAFAIAIKFIRVYLRPSVVYSSRMKLISWNVNGLRAVLKKKFLEFLAAEKPDVLCLQETKCTPDQVEQLWPRHYTTYWNWAQKKGYSGTAIFTKEIPLKVTPHLGITEHDNEGRVLTAEYKDFFSSGCLTVRSGTRIFCAT
jgi:exodeoxyribonuclease-3